MRRQGIQLLAAARQGDIASRYAVGRAYLLGSDGFPRHVRTGIEYLSHASVKGLPEAARIIAESLSLEELLSLQQEQALQDAAQAGSAVAQVKLGAWCCARRADPAQGLRWLEMAAAAGHRGARAALEAEARHGGGNNALPRLLRALSGAGELNGRAVAAIAARDALAARDLPCLLRCLQASIALMPSLDDEIAELVAEAALLAEKTGSRLTGIEARLVEQCLEMRSGLAGQGAAYLLGRALCGIACGSLDPAQLAEGSNVRKGTALLLRAADGGHADAWLHLYRLHADHRSSVSNPQMARYFLEKAAAHGTAQAQRKLGALLLRESASLSHSEEAIHWLHRAAWQADEHAKKLLESLVLPLPGTDDDAWSVIEEVRRTEPWLAVRLRLSRRFGLTKLEALCVDPCRGLRPWGLVVGPNPFISQARLAAARAIPALCDEALADLRRAAAFFDQDRQGESTGEGDLRRRSLRLRRASERHHLDEAMFFSAATSTTLDSLRQGPKWAFRAKESLRLALAA
jgi:TPR repeat protein